MPLTKCGVATTVGGQEMRVGTSRFISQGPFLVYKSLMAVFCTSWAIYWAEASPSVVWAKLTHQTWYIVMAYFFVSTASAYLYWRAINERGARGAEGALEDGQGGCDLTSQNNNSSSNNNNNVDSTPATATTDGPRSPVPLPLRRLQLVVWSIACVVSLVVVALFWFADYKGGPLSSVDILAHILVAPIMLIDQFLVADEFKLRHAIFSMVYGAFYVTFNVIWYYVGYRQRLLYEVMDWGNKPLTACIYGAVCILVLCPLFALVHLFVYRRRERLHSRLQKKLVATGRADVTRS